MTDPAATALPVPAVSVSLVSTDGVDGPTVLGITVSATSGVPLDGDITVRREGSVLPGCDLVAIAGPVPSATTDCTTRLPVGPSRLTASFTPSDGTALSGATSAPATLQLAPAATTVTLALPVHPTVAAAVTYDASVAPAGAHPAHLPLTGTVTFTDDGRTIAGCRAVKLAHERARCRTSYAAAGPQTIAAEFSGDHDFASAASDPRTAAIAYPRPIGAVTAQMRWTFHYTKRYTEIQALSLAHASTGSTVTISCHGKWCPLRTVNRTIRSPGALNLDGWFYDHGLLPGDSVTIAIQRLRYTGKYYRFLIRAGHPPRVLITCLAQGSDRPGVGCARR